MEIHLQMVDFPFAMLVYQTVTLKVSLWFHIGATWFPTHSPRTSLDVRPMKRGVNEHMDLLSFAQVLPNLCTGSLLRVWCMISGLIESDYAELSYTNLQQIHPPLVHHHCFQRLPVLLQPRLPGSADPSHVVGWLLEHRQLLPYKVMWATKKALLSIESWEV